jgi:hypothetical protein
MAQTFSQSITGVSASNAQQPLSIDVPDQVCQTAGSEQLTMQNGTAFLAKQPDGSLVWSVFDTERCIPGVARVIRRLY